MGTHPIRRTRRLPTRSARAIGLTTLLLTALALLAGAQRAGALPAGAIEALQMPVWVDRHGSARPAWAGMRLHSGDRVRTGSGARAQLRLDEGSHVRLGEEAEFVLGELTPPATKRGRFKGFLDVLSGAFRFTTTALSRVHERDIDVRIAGVTAGIRGTDVWGKADAERDIVCLIEGEITVTRGAEPPVTMRDPLTFYVAPHAGPALPVAPVSTRQLATWVAEVSVRGSTGVIRRGGGWRLVLSSHPTQGTALALVAELESAGYPAEIARAEVGGRTWYRIAIDGFSGPEEAQAFAAAITGQFGISDPWIMNEP